jgi:DNA-binding response OmpR family regulator
MKHSTVLLVDDDDRVLTYLGNRLRSAGYAIVSAHDGTEALEKFRSGEQDIIVLDLMMPRMDGLEVMRELRSFSDVPVILLTAKSEDGDKIRGLKLGADDYITKPFNTEELIARIEAVKRRSEPASRRKALGVFEREGLIIDFNNRKAVVKGKAKELTRIEWLLLAELYCNKGQYVPHRQLLMNIWGKEYTNDVNLLRTWVSRLRHKLGDGSGKIIQTVTKAGYIINAGLPRPR